LINASSATNPEADMENENTVATPRTWIRRLVKVNNNAVAKPRTWVRRLVKVLALGSLILLALYTVTRAAWRFSGSNQWELVRDQNGVKVYTLKSPGSDLIQVKGLVRVRSTMGGLVKFMLDPATCNDYGCRESRTLEHVDDWLEYGTFQFNLPFPFQTREFVIRSQVHQDPRTKEVLLTFVAAPDKLPPNDCCFRVTHMNNTLRFTPLGNGEIDIEYIQDMHEGGYLPDLLLNWQRPKLVYSVLRGFQGFLDREKFRNLKLDYIEEK
jgi:hypothetical protein